MIERILEFLIYLLSRWQNRESLKVLGGIPRSPLWSAKQKDYLKKHPRCEISGKTSRLTVHHKKPYHLYPELELVDENLMTLSEGGFGPEGINYHLLFGHLGNYKSYNENIEEDAKEWRAKLLNRP